MRDLRQSLQDHDLGHLRIIAELWGLDLPPGSASEAGPGLAQAMLNPEAISEIQESLSASARRALAFVLAAGGRVPLADLVRRFGPLREMGPGRRDREKPWRDPASPLEALWYRGLIGRAFADTPTGPQEFAFIPNDLQPLLPQPASDDQNLYGRPAGKPAFTSKASTAAVDDATTLLAALRRRASEEPHLPPARLRAPQGQRREDLLSHGTACPCGKEVFVPYQLAETRPDDLQGTEPALPGVPGV
jgi:hypothetical protein